MTFDDFRALVVYGGIALLATYVLERLLEPVERPRVKEGQR